MERHWFALTEQSGVEIAKGLVPDIGAFSMVSTPTIPVSECKSIQQFDS